MNIGRSWFYNVCLQIESFGNNRFRLSETGISNATNIITKLNEQICTIGLRCRRGYRKPEHPYIVRNGSKCGPTYDSLCKHFNSNPMKHANNILCWYNRGCLISGLDEKEQELIVIVFFAEVARGYFSTLESFLQWLTDIRFKKASWLDYETRFEPSKKLDEEYVCEPMPFD